MEGWRTSEEDLNVCSRRGKEIVGFVTLELKCVWNSLSGPIAYVHILLSHSFDFRVFTLWEIGGKPIVISLANFSVQSIRNEIYRDILALQDNWNRGKEHLKLQ